MKRLIMMMVVIFSALTSLKLEAAKLHFQTRAHGKDCEKDRGLCIMIEIEIKEIVTLLGKASWHADGNINGSELRLNTLAIGTPWGGNDFVVDEDIRLNGEISRALGYESVTIKKGTYYIDFTSNKLGNVNLRVDKR